MVIQNTYYAKHWMGICHLRLHGESIKLALMHTLDIWMQNEQFLKSLNKKLLTTINGYPIFEVDRATNSHVLR